MKQYKTEDGYVFNLQDDGTLTDGDMTFDSLEELEKYVDVRPYFGQRLKEWNLIGHCPVDSGQLMITDPCYLDKWEDKNFQDIRVYQSEDGNTLQYPKDFSNYEQVIDGYDTTMNDLVSREIFKKVKNPRDDSFSYNAARQITIEDNYGEFGNGLAVASSTGWGDGRYPVYAKVDEETGRVKELKIIFMEEE